MTACYPSTCYEYPWFPTEAELAAESTPSAETTAALTAINAMKVTSPPMTEVQKCQAYCKAVTQAENEKARRMREKAAAALKAAGYPSKVTAYGSKSRGCGSYSAYRGGASACSTGACPIEATTSTTTKRAREQPVTFNDYIEAGGSRVGSGRLTSPLASGDSICLG